MATAVIVLILFFSIILHEVSHGVAAYVQGDPTAKNAGRLTLNPMPHIDPIGTLVLPAILVFFHSPILLGWARPVPFNPMYFKNKRLGVFTVGMAGPITNLILAGAFALGIRACGLDHAISPFLLYGVSINIFLAIFNLVPIPPLDGSRAVSAILPRGARIAYQMLEPFGFLILIALLYTGVLSTILGPFYKACLKFFTGLEGDPA